jgi:hypothetical protein
MIFHQRIVWIVAMSIYIAAFESAFAKSGSNSKCASVLFVREEENGSMNLLPSSILIDGKCALSIAGGTASRLRIAAGQHVFQIVSRDLYDPASHHLWTSRKWKIRLVSDTRYEARISPLFQRSAYNGRWGMWIKQVP